MSDLGAFGAAVKEADDGPRDTFTFCGHAFEVAGPIPAILMVKLGAATGGGVSEKELLTCIWKALQHSLGDQFDAFVEVAEQNAAGMEDLMRLTMALFQATDGRPTEAAPGSGPGPQSTSPSSSGSSSTLQVLPGMRSVTDLIEGTG